MLDVRRRPRPVAFVAAASAAVLLPSLASAQTADEQSLQTARQRIEQVAAELAQAEADRTAADTSLAEADAQLTAVEQVVNEVAASLDRQQVAVEEATRQLGQLEQDGEELITAFGKRAADVYKKGSGLPYELVLASGGVQDAIERSAFLRVITSADQADLEQITSNQVAIAAQRTLVLAEQERLRSMKTDQDALLVQVAAIRETRAIQAAESRAQVGSLSAEKDELEKDEAELRTLIKQRQSTPSSSSAPSRSGYRWPLCGPITSEFGRRWGRLHAGIDIDGDTGDRIGASKAGVVISAGVSSGYGNLTVIDHGDGVVTAYAHQDSIAVSRGQRVQAGQYIGAVGNSGRSTGSHLHFETRVNGTAVNPRRYMSSGC